MSPVKTFVRYGALSALALLTLSLGTNTATAQTSATQLNFPVDPLFLGAAVEPNIILALDNSGSTDWEVSVKSNNGAIWWNDGSGSGTCSGTSQRGFAGCSANASGDLVSSGTINFNYGGSFSSPWDGYGYLFPDGTTTSVGGKLYGDGGGSGGINIYSIPPIPAFGWTRSSISSSNSNRAYFDPNQVYSPWVNSDGTKKANASPTAAAVDPTISGALTFDLTSDVVSNGSTATASACNDTAITTHGTGTSEWGFRVFTGMTIPQNTCMLVLQKYCTGSSCATAYTGDNCSGSGSTKSCTGPRWTSLAAATAVGSNAISGDSNSVISNNTTIFIRYFPATFYLPHNTASPYSNYIGTIISGLDQAGNVMDGYQIKPGNFSGGSTDTQYVAAIQNFANWFTYYRKRLLSLQNGVGAAFNDLSINVRVGEFVIGSNSSSNTISMLRTAVTSDKSTFYSTVYSLNSSGGTPNREAVRHMGDQYRNNTNIITSVCQKNFGILFTDGYSAALSGSATYTGTGNTTGQVDGNTTNTAFTTYGTGTNPYKDSVAYTMADETMYDYVGPLRNSGNDTNNIPYSGSKKVQVNPACPTNTSGIPTGVPPTGSPTMDCNPQLHMDFYGVILNTTGFVYDGSTNATANAYTTTPTWPTSSGLGNQDAGQVDDLWHATINGRGKLLNATSPADVATQLSNVLNTITAETAAAGAVALNSTTLKSTSDVYEATFFSGDWHGNLYSFPLNSDGSVGNPATWDAGAKVKAQSANSRVIMTYSNSSYSGVPFEWTSGIDTNEQNFLNISPDTGSADGNGQLRLNFLRGDQSHETSTSIPRFHARPTTVLGDIADSSPVFVGDPAFLYSDSTYAAFKTAHTGRTPMVYVGSNDGMLHAFEADATTNGGKELMAYVPSRAFGVSNGSTKGKTLLSNLTQQTYTHQYVVDGSPTVVDAQVGSSLTWKSVLVGGMRTGGRGLFALDVTDPSSTAFAESNASNIVMWEFTNADDADLGYTFSKPSIVKLANNKWAAIVGNGYNNTDTAGGADANYSGGSSSTTATSHVGQPALYIIFLDGPGGTSTTASRWRSGTDYIKIMAGSGTTTTPNGLGEPVAVDVNGDGIADFIYAGDLQGKLWRFNVTDSSPSNWGVAFTTTANPNGQPIFIAKDYAGATLPITARPDVGLNLNQSNPNNLSHPQLAVYFGTGRYIDSTDNSSTSQQTQSFFGIFDDFSDKNATPSTTPTAIYRDSSSGTPASNMLKQSILFEVNISGATCAVTDDCFRITSNNSISSSNKGWFMDLYNTAVATEATAVSSSLNKGEKQVSTPVLRFGRIIFTTLIPSTDPCTFGGGGFLMELDALDGSSLPASPIDVTQNGTVDSSDTITVNGTVYTVSGQNSTVGILSTPAILNIDGKLENKYLGGSTAAIATVTESAANRSGRITWREIIP